MHRQEGTGQIGHSNLGTICLILVTQGEDMRNGIETVACPAQFMKTLFLDLGGPAHANCSPGWVCVCVSTAVGLWSAPLHCMHVSLVYPFTVPNILWSQGEQGLPLKLRRGLGETLCSAAHLTPWEACYLWYRSPCPLPALALSPIIIKFTLIWTDWTIGIHNATSSQWS